MEENPYKAPAQQQPRTMSDRNWPRQLRRWSHGQPLALFYLFVLVIGALAALLLPMLQR
jgi:hypothetical protein